MTASASSRRSVLLFVSALALVAACGSSDSTDQRGLSSSSALKVCASSRASRASTCPASRARRAGILAPARLVRERDLAPDHGLDQRVLGKVGEWPVGLRDSAVAQHRHAVADGVDLLNLIREHDCEAVGGKSAHKVEQVLGLVRRKGSSRLVQDQDATRDARASGDLHDLLLTTLSRDTWIFRVEVDADAMQLLCGPPVGGGVIHQPEPRAGHLAKIDVLGNRETGNPAATLGRRTRIRGGRQTYLGT